MCSPHRIDQIHKKKKKLHFYHVIIYHLLTMFAHPPKVNLSLCVCAFLRFFFFLCECVCEKLKTKQQIHSLIYYHTSYSMFLFFSLFWIVSFCIALCWLLLNSLMSSSMPAIYLSVCLFLFPFRADSTWITTSIPIKIITKNNNFFCSPI